MSKEKGKSTTRAPRQPSAPADETKAQKFVRLGKKRTAKAIAAIRNIGKLGGSGYERTPDQVKTITKLLTDEVMAATAALNATKAQKAVIEVAL